MKATIGLILIIIGILFIVSYFLKGDKDIPYIEDMINKCKDGLLEEGEYLLLKLIAFKQITNKPHDSAQDLIDNMLSCATKKGDFQYIALLHDRRGVLYKQHGMPDLALEHYNKALGIALENEYHDTTIFNINLISDSYNHIGNVYRDAKKDYKEAINMYTMALEHIKSHGCGSVAYDYQTNNSRHLD